MRTLTQAILLAGIMLWAWPLPAQQGQSCSNYSIIIGSPEDKLMLAVNGTDDPNAKVAALEKFAQEHADSNYAPCVDELLTRNYVKLKEYDKAIAAGQKAVAANRLDVSFLEDLLQAYIGSGNASDDAFDVIAKAAPQIKAETVVFTKINASAEQVEQAKKSALQQAKSDTDYMVYAFLNLFPRVADANRRIKLLDQFSQAYPEVVKERAGNFNYRYAVAYAQINQPDKADEYAEKAIAADPNGIETLNLVAYDYAFRVPAKRGTAAEYAQKVVALIPTMKKPDGVSDDQFKTQQNNQEGMAHLTLGYLDLVKNANAHRVAGAVREFAKAASLLATDPELQGQAYYLLGFSYETLYPPEHRRALAALEHAVKLQSSTQGKARELLAKVRQVAR
jgi:tetratricopeptide (TPR) repeat protein